MAAPNTTARLIALARCWFMSASPLWRLIPSPPCERLSTAHVVRLPVL
jgi:hypothetical protein